MLTVVTGPPCAGKTTYVAAERKPTDMVIDLDALAHAFGYPDEQIEWGSKHAAVAAARLARTRVLSALLRGELRGAAWVIDTHPDRAMRAQYQRAGARIVTIDPGPTVCLERAKSRGPATVEGVEGWYRTRAGNSRPAALDIFG